MRKFLLITCLMGILSPVLSQEIRTYSDEELTKYAQVMVWAENEKGRMTEVYNGWINNNENLNAPRFLDIKRAKGDSVKLLEIEASESELTAYNNIQVNYDSMTSSFKEVYIGKIKEDIGAGLYNALKAELKKNEEVKNRYEAVVAGLKEESGVGESEE